MKLRTKREVKELRINEDFELEWAEDVISDEEFGTTAKVWIYPLTPEEANKLIKKSSEREWDNNQRFVDVNFYKYKIGKIDRVIENWEGFEDEHGNPLECNRANKAMLFNHETEFIDKILEMADKITKRMAEEQEEEAKNSEAGQNGSAKTN